MSLQRAGRPVDPVVKRAVPTGGTIALVLAALACATATERDPGVEARIRRVETGLLTHHLVRGEDAGLSIEERLRFYRVPAASVAVIVDGRIEWARAWGELEAGSGVPADTTTRFQAASISKPVAAAAALRLVEAGALALDEDVNERLESWRVPESAFTREAPVTLRGLLGHTAGTTVSGFPGYASGEPVPTLAQVLEGAPPANTDPVVVDTVPGTRFRYSGGGYSIVQLLIEEAAGRPFHEVVEASVLEPAGMVHSAFDPPPDESDLATAHGRDGAPIPGRYHVYPELAAAGLWSTPSDLARFVIEIQRALAGKEDRVVSPESARRMIATGEGDPYGLGLWADGAADSLWFYHGGSNAGFQSWMMGSGEGGRGFVVMTNGDGGFDLAIEIARSIAREYGWRIFLQTERDAVEVPVETLAAYAGTYRSEPEGEGEPFVIEVRLEDGELRASLPSVGWIGRRLRAETPTRFFFLENPGELEFERDGTGAASAVVLHGFGDPLRAVR